ncbi:DUF2851 family protein [Parabacteroides sp. PF5-6]|uniref:DUF2851 family protein n=1 Tax=Parabacteroides sp. PF5-6 TaxID=1742403 RepID=UPI002404C232|nr:DUF2851 family protein [Parabacteroides sp. PF5-6]MDF9830502.1 hypothetical protein [Parabacteroides sp. PF5-6]
MERLLQYVWKYKLYKTTALTTTDGTPIQVIDTGIHNTDAGPDFFNAKIKIDQTVWAGSVEIHEKASDWLVHHHDLDKAYDAVILHIVGSADAVIRRTTGEIIPQIVIRIPDAVSHNINWLLHHDTNMPCLPYIRDVEPVHLSGWVNALLQERLERKTRNILDLLKLYNNDWNEVFYIMLTRSFGFGINSDSFEWLAKSLPFQCIRKQRDNPVQVEALLFGQAGMLEYPGRCPYYLLLQREFHFLKQKYNLRPLDASLFKNLRVRPGNFPYQRLAQLAAIWTAHGSLFSLILESNVLNQMKGYLKQAPSEYWKTHYHFRYASPQKEKTIGEDSLNILLINTVIPMLFAYGKQKRQEIYCERALHLLETLPPEKNSIIYTFNRAGIPTRHAGDTQALIQLKREYCESKKCLYCRIGFRFLKRAVPRE